MKRISIQLIVFCLLLASCGSRSVSKTKEERTAEQKKEEQTKVKSEQVEQLLNSK